MPLATPPPPPAKVSYLPDPPVIMPLPSNSILAVPLGAPPLERIHHDQLPHPPPASTIHRHPVETEPTHIPSSTPALPPTPSGISPGDQAAEEAAAPQLAFQGDKCGLCKQKFSTVEAPSSTAAEILSASDFTRCMCCQRVLYKSFFSTNQLISRGKDEIRCRTCATGGWELLAQIRKTSSFERARVVGANIEKWKIAAEKRKATIARKQLEKQQHDEKRHRMGLLPVDQNGDNDDDDNENQNHQHVSVATMDPRHMEKALRNILRDHRSIMRRRQANGLQGPDREMYELELLDEESKLHNKAVSLRLANDVLFDQMSEELHVVDGAVRFGERDHEQGEYDGDKPNKKKNTKNAKSKSTTSGVENGYALLQATTIRQVQTDMYTRRAAPQAEEDDAEPVRKKAKCMENETSHEDPSLYTEKALSPRKPLTIMTRARRRPVPKVIEIDDSDE